jgi:tetratricopeptide (TPR) repeat protein
MKFFFFPILISLTFGGCFNQKKLAAKKNQAESYYLKAFEILNNTSHNALSRTLAEQALVYINQAIVLDSGQSKYFRVKGTAYYHMKDYEQALRYQDKALRLDSTNWLAWMGRGIALENSGQYAAAEQSYLKALSYEKSSAIYFNLGMVYSKWEKDSLSILYYDQAIKLFPEYGSAYINRGQVKLLMGRYLEAISDFNTGISFDSEDKISYNNRGLCKYYLGQYEDAINDFKKALSIELGESFNENFDTDKYSLNNIANSYFALGNTKEACDFWNKAIQMGYKYRPEWKKEYNIDDPVELIKKYCKQLN